MSPPTNIPTPRTDALLGGRLPCQALEFELRDFARQLERDRAELREALGRLERAVSTFEGDAAFEDAVANGDGEHDFNRGYANLINQVRAARALLNRTQP